jgi:hypothetical protein
MRWLDDVESEKVKGWKEKMRNREQWRLIVEEAKAHPGLECRVEGRITVSTTHKEGIPSMKTTGVGM